jgi:type II secretory ATPase GspE/PulE/Tfp pilus assembly ATPase PilB-like protein
VFARLLHQGFEPFLIAAAISGVVAQRLVHNRDGTARFPIAATLDMTDQWRDFLAGAPSSAAIRDQISRTPGSSIGQVAQSLAAEGAIPEMDVYLL